MQLNTNQIISNTDTFGWAFDGFCDASGYVLFLIGCKRILTNLIDQRSNYIVKPLKYTLPTNAVSFANKTFWNIQTVKPKLIFSVLFNSTILKKSQMKRWLIKLNKQAQFELWSILLLNCSLLPYFGIDIQFCGINCWCKEPHPMNTW